MVFKVRVFRTNYIDSIERKLVGKITIKKIETQEEVKEYIDNLDLNLIDKIIIEKGKVRR